MFNAIFISEEEFTYVVVFLIDFHTDSKTIIK